MPGPVNRFFGDIAWQFLRGRLDYLVKLAREYGDIVTYKIGDRPFVLFSHPDAVREILIVNEDAFNKGVVLRRSRSVLGDGLLTSEGDFHRRQRRIAQPVFHPQRMAIYSPIIVEYAQRTSDRWRDGQEFDLHEQMMRLALEIVSKTLFGAEVENDLDQIGHDMDMIVRRFTRALSPLTLLLNYLPLPSNLLLKRSVRRLHGVLDRFIEERHSGASESAGQQDLLTLLLKARDSEGDHAAMTDKQLRDECMTIFAAGHETTANALTFTFLLLARNPLAAEQVHRELAGVLQGRAPTHADLERLIYTRAAVAESMRLYPPAWGLARQALRDVTITGQLVPAGAVVLAAQWVVHRDPRWWPDPEAFKLERWITPDPDRPRWSYFPFGGGPRQCIGEAFAWTEAILALATLAQKWRIDIPDPNPPKLLATITLRPKHPLIAVVRSRVSDDPPSWTLLRKPPE
jgi:cytochrome P450